MCFYPQIISIIILLVLALSLSSLSLLPSSRVYNKLRWRNSSLCSNSTNKSLVFSRPGLSTNLIVEMKLVMRCGVRCGMMGSACFSFQVDVISLSFDVYNVACFHFNDLPNSIHISNFNNNCSFYIAEKPIYLNVSSWGYNDVNKKAPDSSLIDITGMRGYLLSTNSRGVNVYKLNMEDASLYDFKRFDIYDNSSKVVSLQNYLMNITNGTVLIEQVADDAYQPAFSRSFTTFMKGINLDVIQLRSRVKWVFVWQQAAYEKSLSFFDTANKSDWTEVKIQTIS
ncbi:hypothetical protein HELRODRAFT_178527 [Helobdella robusta]|uniref:ILEI/PANDER domain-containing protein n=1 Tax=Helobdella robusta TaxID=6412 RepID=T1FDB3_HELRO|nr:hypothetical protein HELRODRAFT_178527 [Helobdella robusta]ESN97078.1 hypothetical protein HELRODRAFT_178527 [Helobdella robusta]